MDGALRRPVFHGRRKIGMWGWDMDGLARICALGLILGLAACNAPPGVDDPGEPQAGRDETRGIRATEHVGYSGDAIADQVDDMLDGFDQRGTRLDSQLEEQMSGE